MRSLKILGLVAVAVAAMLSLGAGSASATVLCETTEAPCPAESTYPAETTFEAQLAEGSEVELVTASEIVVNCSGSSLKGSTTAERGMPLAGKVTELSFSGCSGPCKGTTATSLNTPHGADLEATTAGDGTMTLRNGGAGEPRIRFASCLVKCTYSASGTEFDLQGGNPATLSLSGAQMTRKEGSEFFCGTSAQIDATYEVTSPAPLYAGKGANLSEAALCKENKSPCPAASQYLEGTALNASLLSSTELWFVNGGGLLYNCTTSSIESTVLAEATTGAPANIDWFKLGGCIGWGKNCTETVAWSQPWHTEFIPTSSGDGEVEISNMKIRFTCNGITCRFGASQATLDFEGGSGAELIANEVPLVLEEGNSKVCGNWATMDANYTFSSPSPLYIEPI